MEGRAGELAQELLATGVRAMKIWPWDQFGVSLGGPVGQRAGVGAVGPVGHYLDPDDLKKVSNRSSRSARGGRQNADRN